MILLSAWMILAGPVGPVKPAHSHYATKPILSCTYPVNSHDTAKSLLSKYKGAKIGDVYIGDSQLTGVRLFPDEVGREIDVTFSDEKMTHVEFVMTQDKSTWYGPKRLHLGSSLSDVVTANGGKAVDISGFGWDYGGWILNTHGGPLNGLAGDGCFFGVQLDTSSEEEGDDKIYGDGVTLSSTDKAVIKAKPIISEMSVSFTQAKP